MAGMVFIVWLSRLILIILFGMSIYGLSIILERRKFFKAYSMVSQKEYLLDKLTSGDTKGLKEMLLDLGKNPFASQILSIINDMTKTLDHRGPDSKGCWINKDKNLALGHRRLSILEISNLGKQPMESKNKRYLVIPLV